MSFEEMQKIRELQVRVSALEEQIKQLIVAQRKPTLSLPVKPPKAN